MFKSPAVKDFYQLSLLKALGDYENVLQEVVTCGFCKACLQIADQVLADWSENGE